MTNSEAEQLANKVRLLAEQLGSAIDQLRAHEVAVTLTVHSDDGEALSIHRCTGEIATRIVAEREL